MRYILKFRSTEVGVIESTDEDFPNLWGEFKIDKNVEEKPLLAFIELSKRESKLIDEDHIRDISSDIAELEKEMEPYLYFVESDDWTLETECNEVLKILGPSFKPDGSIMWRWRS